MATDENISSSSSFSSSSSSSIGIGLLEDEDEEDRPMKTPFRGFTAILYKEFLVVLRDPITLFFMFFPPLLQMIMFGYALDTDVKNVALVILDEDRTTESRQIVDRFINTGTF